MSLITLREYKNVFIEGGDRRIEPSFEHGINVHYMKGLAQLERYKPKIYTNEYASYERKYLVRSNEKVPVHHTGTTPIHANTRLAVVPPIVDKRGAQLSDGTILLQTVPCDDYNYNLNQLVDVMRLALSFMTRFTADTHEDKYREMMDWADGKLYDNILWNDMKCAAYENDRIMESDVKRFINIMNVVRNYWAEPITTAEESHSRDSEGVLSQILYPNQRTMRLIRDEVVDLYQSGDDEKEFTPELLDKFYNSQTNIKLLAQSLIKRPVLAVAIVVSAPTFDISTGDLMDVVLLNH